MMHSKLYFSNIMFVEMMYRSQILYLPY